MEAFGNQFQEDQREDKSRTQGKQVLLDLLRPLLPQDDKASPQQFRQRRNNTVDNNEGIHQ